MRDAMTRERGAVETTGQAMEQQQAALAAAAVVEAGSSRRPS